MNKALFLILPTIILFSFSANGAPKSPTTDVSSTETRTSMIEDENGAYNVLSIFEFEYNKRGELLRRIQKAGSGDVTVTYVHNKKGQLIEKHLLYSDQYTNKYTYSYNPDGTFWKREYDLLNDGSVERSVEVIYDNNGNVMEAIHFGNGTYYSYSFDYLNPTAFVKTRSDTGDFFYYTTDDNGNILTKSHYLMDQVYAVDLPQYSLLSIYNKQGALLAEYETNGFGLDAKRRSYIYSYDGGYNGPQLDDWIYNYLQ
ncbi:hypothetical protein [Pseudoalteromonas pernae]|uniref:hypothetical protein n=1 Tax=Pseudoalteromonas pernae TaxID=3118054 RepID=UPI0032427099